LGIKEQETRLTLQEHDDEKITQIIEKNINQITRYCAEEGPDRGSEDIKKECNVNCFDIFFFSVFLMDVMVGKIIINFKKTALK
jgi:hypothetical protein